MPTPAPTDDDVLARVRAGDVASFEIVMRRYNQRLYRAARAIVGDDREAEDVVQETYVRAFARLDQFEGRAAFATWLTRIAVHEALARIRQRGRFDPLAADDVAAHQGGAGRDVEDQAAAREIGRALERAVDALPDAYRAVFVLRDVEELSTAETAALLELRAETVKTRLHRARALLRAALRDGIRDTYAFGNARCDRIVAAVLHRLGHRVLH
jgi:RNA polymerase sigma-70 factor (ECF subfamily)